MASMNSPALIDPVAVFIMFATLILSPLGAIAGGNIADWFIDRHDGFDENNNDLK
jgi:hypothetical protein